MNEDKFISELIALKPSIEKLLAANYDKNSIAAIVGVYNIKIRIRKKQSNGKYIVERLLYKYYMTNVEIGHIRFANEPIHSDLFLTFGQFDTFRLVVLKNSGNIAIMDAIDDVVSQYCARNEESFLNAILEAEKHFNACLLDKGKSDNQFVVCRKAEQLSIIAGSKTDFLDFYKTLIGCFSSGHVSH